MHWHMQSCKRIIHLPSYFLPLTIGLQALDIPWNNPMKIIGLPGVDTRTHRVHIHMCMPTCTQHVEKSPCPVSHRNGTCTHHTHHRLRGRCSLAPTGAASSSQTPSSGPPRPLGENGLFYYWGVKRLSCRGLVDGSSTY